MITALAASVDHLFVRKYRAKRRTPVDRHFGNVSKPLLIELLENPLRPLVILRIGGIDFAIPVVGEAKRADLLAEAVDILFRGNSRVSASLYGILLGRKTECVPSHRMQDIEALHALVAAKNVGSRITFGVADMQSRTGRIRKHIKAVELFACLGVIRLESLVFEPVLLPLLLDGGKIIFAHFCLRSSACSAIDFAIKPETSLVAAATPAFTA